MAWPLSSQEFCEAAINSLVTSIANAPSGYIAAGAASLAPATGPLAPAVDAAGIALEATRALLAGSEASQGTLTEIGKPLCEYTTEGLSQLGNALAEDFSINVFEISGKEPESADLNNYQPSEVSGPIAGSQLSHSSNATDSVIDDATESRASANEADTDEDPSSFEFAEVENVSSSGDDGSYDSADDAGGSGGDAGGDDSGDEAGGGGGDDVDISDYDTSDGSIFDAVSDAIDRSVGDDGGSSFDSDLTSHISSDSTFSIDTTSGIDTTSNIDTTSSDLGSMN